MINITLLRWIGNLFLIVGYCTILYFDFKTGLTVKFFGGLLILPSLLQLKMWDGVIIASFFAVIEGAKMLQLYFGQ